jgi:hypothetical protein
MVADGTHKDACADGETAQILFYGSSSAGIRGRVRGELE